MPIPTFALRYICCLLALLMAAASPRALAHDFWISAHRIDDAHGPAVHMWVGHHLEAEEGRAYDAARTERFELLTPDGTRNLVFGARDGSRPYRRLAPELTPPALVVLDRNPVDIALDSAKFDSYLAEEHLDDILARRRGAAKAGRERYTRHIKLLVGNDTGDLHARRIGQPLEIVLLDPPGQPAQGRRLRAQVLFDRKPLAGRTVTIVSDPDARFDNHNARARTAVTDSQGTVSFDYDRAGFWLLRLVHMQPCTTGCGDADWRSWWAAYAIQPDWLPAPAMR
jgi:uncharacterized GH25 family protein